MGYYNCCAQLQITPAELPGQDSCADVSTLLLHPKVKLWQDPTLIHAASRSAVASPEPVMVFPSIDLDSVQQDYNIHSNPEFGGGTSGEAELPDNISLRNTVLQLDDLISTLLTRNSRTCRPSDIEALGTVPGDHREENVFVKERPATGQQVHESNTHVGNKFSLGYLLTHQFACWCRQSAQNSLFPQAITQRAHWSVVSAPGRQTVSRVLTLI